MSLFSVRDCKGKRVATLGLERKGAAWEVFQFRGFANQPVLPSLAGIDEAVCSHFANYWRNAQAIAKAAEEASDESER